MPRSRRDFDIASCVMLAAFDFSAAAFLGYTCLAKSTDGVPPSQLFAVVFMLLASVVLIAFAWSRLQSVEVPGTTALVPCSQRESHLTLFSLVVGGFVLLFLAVLVLLSLFGFNLPTESRVYVILLFSMSCGLSFGLIGGSGMLRGHLNVPFATERPITFAISGGAVVTIVTFVILKASW